jgi:hypothetical protein
MLEKIEGDNHQTLPRLATQDTMTARHFIRRYYLSQLVLVIREYLFPNTKETLCSVS